METKLMLDNLLGLLSNYMKVSRATVTRDRLQAHVDEPGLEITDLKLRETLTEHVGQLPIIATFLYPQIEKKSEVNLPKVLIMLSIHDIAETVLGDVPTTYKDDQREDLENQQTKAMLQSEYLEIYEEFEKEETSTSKFALAVDLLTNCINDLLLPAEITIKRLDAWKFDLNKIYSMKKKYFEWDKTLNELFNIIFDEYRKRGASFKK